MKSRPLAKHFRQLVEDGTCQGVGRLKQKCTSVRSLRRRCQRPRPRPWPWPTTVARTAPCCGCRVLARARACACRSRAPGVRAAAGSLLSTRRKRTRPASRRVPTARRGECGAGVQGKTVGRRRSGPLGAQPSRDRGSGLPGPRLLRSLVAPRWSASPGRAATPWAPATAAARVLSAGNPGRLEELRCAWRARPRAL